MTPSLTSFKFIAAFVFFLFHMQFFLGWKTGVEFFDIFVSNGPTFMTGFFVLTGFIMMHVYNGADFSKDTNIFKFYTKRFAKVYPLYIASTILYFALHHDCFFESPIRITLDDTLLFQAFFPSVFKIGFNQFTWFISAKLFIFFIFPLIMIIMNYKARRCFIFSAIITLIVIINIFISQQDEVFSNPIFRLADFSAGMGFYLIKDKLKNINKFGIMHIFSFVLLITSCIILGGIKYQHMLCQFLTIPLFGLWIIYIYHSKSIIYNNKILVYFGDITYSFYLWQFCSIAIGQYLIKFHQMNINLVVPLCLVTSIIIGSFFHHLMETPIRELILRKIKFEN